MAAPDPVITDIADAVVAELNSKIAPQVPPPGGDPLPPLFVAARVYAPVFDLGEMKDLHVTVVTKAATAERFDRAARQFDYSIDVAVQKKLAPEDGNAQIDALIGLVEQIGDYFYGTRLPAVSTAVCVRTDNDPIYSPDHMRDMRQFTSVLTLVFRVVR